MNSPYISVIVPIFNAEATIEKLLDSVIGQTLGGLELILIDDCSSDNTVQVVEKKLANQNIRHLLIKNETNQGQSFSRRLGLSKASAEYISFIDADDWLDPTMYETMYEQGAKKEFDIVTCDHFVELNNKSTIVSNSRDDLIDGILTNKIAGSLWNKLFKRELFDSSIVWPKLNMGEDGAICIQLILRTKSIRHINKPLYHYYINPNSTINKREKDDYLRRSMGLKESSDIIFASLKQYDLLNKYSLAILFRKVYVCLLASPIISDTKVYKEIITLYSDLSYSKIIFSSLPFSMKLRYILFRSRLYPYLKKIKTL